MKKNFFYLVVVFLTLLGHVLILGCNKSPEVVEDHAPKTQLGAAGSLSLDAISSIELNRGDATSTQAFNINVLDGTNAKTVTKILDCGVMKLENTKNWGEVGSTSFSFGETEFPGLSNLPKVSDCELKVVLTNNLGSTSSSSKKITLKFKTNPPITANLDSYPAGNVYVEGAATNFLIAHVNLQNPLPYQKAFRVSLSQFHPVATTAWVGNLGGARGDRIIAASIHDQIPQVNIQIDGAVSDIKQADSTTWYFKVDAQQTATITLSGVVNPVGYISVGMLNSGTMYPDSNKIIPIDSNTIFRVYDRCLYMKNLNFGDVVSSLDEADYAPTGSATTPVELSQGLSLSTGGYCFPMTDFKMRVP